MKCSMCKNEIKKTFLDKIKGTYIKKSKKFHPVCSACQKQHSIKEIKKLL